MVVVKFSLVDLRAYLPVLIPESIKCFLENLLEVNPFLRLGATDGVQGIKKDDMFRHVLPTPAHWQKLEGRQLAPPLNPSRLRTHCSPSTGTELLKEADESDNTVNCPWFLQNFDVPLGSPVVNDDGS
ncbi:hypothetical protein ACOMHN_025803 [Nucella lapillus]